MHTSIVHRLLLNIHILIVGFCTVYAPLICAGQHSLLIKFTSNSPQYTEWKKNGRSGEIRELTAIIGIHRSAPFLKDQTLALLANKDASYSQNNNKQSPDSEHLDALAILEYTSDIVPLIAAKKIQSLRFIQYAEPKPQHRLIGVPNDPMLSLQNYLNQIKAFDAWNYYDSLLQKDSVVLAIVDTGIDTNHEDLSSVLYINSGEDGFDQKGNSKRYNGFDDDMNGFIDDWQGWDFVSTESPVTGDNEPYPGHFHGTHVAGIAAALSNNEIGIAGIARRMKILPVKVSQDDSNSLNVENSYEGLLYAAAMGARIINCSWGSPSPSQAEAEIVAKAQQYGCLIIAGAGNDGKETAFYPASYPNVVSVAAVYYDATKASYSNYSNTIDISAPGSSIYSTMKGNTYGYSSGTSMASPIVAGTAALIASVYPNLDAQQIAARLLATSINNDSVNPLYATNIGFGVVDCFSALTSKAPKYIAFIQKQLTDETADDMYTPGESVELSLTVKNILSIVDSAYIIASIHDTNMQVLFKTDSLFIGTLQPSTIYSLPLPIQFTLPNNPPYNYPLHIQLDVFSGATLISRDVAELVINPTYRTLAENNITVTINSQGNIGFNDYPSNVQGIGLKTSYDPSSVLFEGAFMAGISPEQLSNVARDASGEDQDQSFSIHIPIKTSIPGILAEEEAYISFKDEKKADQAGLSIQQTVYQFKEDSVKNVVFLSYEITNISGKNYDSLFAGLFFDWDIGPAGQNNICGFNQLNGYGYCYNSIVKSLPYIGVALLTGQALNYYAIDNDGGGGAVNIYNGFSRNEKWRTMSGGLSRAFTRPTDVSMVIAGGPLPILMDETKKFVFVIASASNEYELEDWLIKSSQFAISKGIGSGFTWNQGPKNTQLINITIGRDQAVYIDYQVSGRTQVDIELFDNLGRSIQRRNLGYKNAGIYSSERVSFDGLSSGTYFIRMITGYGQDALPFVIIR